MAKKSKIYTQKFKTPVTISVEVLNEKLKISGLCELVDFHKQQCCENVYADWNYLIPFINQINWPISIIGFEIIGVKYEGFLLKFVTDSINEFDGLNDEVKFFVPCYNSQNGYYSSNLDLQIITEDGQKIVKSINYYVKDKIYG